MTLATAAEIRTGYSFRGRVEADPSGLVKVIQMKDIDRSNRVRPETIARILPIGDLRPHWLQEGDLLFRCRGESYSAAIVPDGLGQAIAASPLMVIRPKRVMASPAYLRWFLNQGSTQNLLSSIAAGSAVKIINKAALERLEIPLPSPDRQRRIAEIGELAEEEARLARELVDLRRQLTEKTLLEEARRKTLER